MGSIGTGELLLIFFVVLLVFGAKRIPEIARNMGTALSEFRSATREIQRQLNVDTTIQPPRTGAAVSRAGHVVPEPVVATSAPELQPTDAAPAPPPASPAPTDGSEIAG